MNVDFFPRWFVLLLLLASAFGQSAPARPQVAPQNSPPETVASAGSPQAPVSYASVSQLNGLLAQLEAASQATQADLAKLRIERWKTDSGSKKQALGESESIQRNLQNSLPEVISQLRNAPEDMPATFKLYRNLEVLCDVISGIVESTGAFGPKDDFQALSTDLNNFESTRKQLAERMETLAASKEQEISRLRADLKKAQAATPAPPPKKTVVDDTEPPPPKAPPVKKKPAPKKPAATPGQGASPANPPPAQNQTPPSKPQ